MTVYNKDAENTGGIRGCLRCGDNGNAIADVTLYQCYECWGDYCALCMAKEQLCVICAEKKGLDYESI